MPKPAPRTPSTPTPPAAAAAAAAGLHVVAPAPGNGIPVAEQLSTSPATPATQPPASSAAAGSKPPPLPRRGKQIAVRIPEDLYDRLRACMDGTRYPQNRLVERALDAELKQHGY